MYSSSTDGITHRLYCLFMKSTESFIIRTTDLAGYKADIRSVAIQSFGNAFLLPLDVILGGIFTNDKRQRIFSRAGNTSNEGQKWRQQPECPLQKGWLGSLFSFEASK